MIMKSIAGITLMTIAAAAPAFAQGSSNGQAQTSPNMQAMNESGKSVRQQIEQDLTSKGFSNVQVEASSFLVRAKNKQGEPVMMVIGPDSFTEVTELPAGSGQGNSGNGSSSSGGSAGSSGGSSK